MRALVWVLVVGLAGVASAQSVEDPSLEVTEYVSGLSAPTTMAFLGADDLLVLEKATGNVRRVIGGQLQANPVLTLSVNSASERGLLGIAIDESDPQNVFLYYTQASPLRHIVARYQWDSGTASLISGQTVLDIPGTPGPNHDGGILVLGPPGEEPGQGDGSLLYAVIGDLNRQGVLQNVPLGPVEDDTSVIFRVRHEGQAAAGNPLRRRRGSLLRLRGAEQLRYGARSGDRGAVGHRERAEPYGRDQSRRCGLQQRLASDHGAGIADDGDAGRSLRVGGVELQRSRVLVGYAHRCHFDRLPHDGNGRDAREWHIPERARNALQRRRSRRGLQQRRDLPLPAERDAHRLRSPGLHRLGDLVADSATERLEVLWGDGFGIIADIKTGPDGALYVSSLSSGRIYRVAQLPSLPALPQAWGALCALGLVRLGRDCLRRQAASARVKG